MVSTFRTPTIPALVRRPLRPPSLPLRPFQPLTASTNTQEVQTVEQMALVNPSIRGIPILMATSAVHRTRSARFQYALYPYNTC